VDAKLHKVSAVEVIEPNGDKVCGGSMVVALRNTLLVFLRFFHLALERVHIHMNSSLLPSEGHTFDSETTPWEEKSH